MPMIDAMWPDHALTPDAEARLVRELTDILIEAEGYDPANPIVQRDAANSGITRNACKE